ncbi:MAG TPA: envelope integrity protein Cei [Actinophytocola sp.]|uniref:envelope integrity protein Cei n=1 Tax=Actinophytocola sp. TaxID=1872138 RepID=UPI002DDCCC51|nr:envelope integrity protein Cei [Actinophytocola sp.]HEV2779116.1 envelope integrity protein Cei [Actinophytocola sp.]
MAGGRVRYRKRRPLPALLMILALGVVATVVWLRVLGSDADPASATSCNPPATPATPPVAVEGQPPPTTLGQSLAHDALDRTSPIPAAQVLIRVVNASTQRGQAAEVTESLRQLGFGQVADPANDPLYPAFDLGCRAQIRFGQQGISGARTLSLIEPCAELVRDDRQDATVDLAIGRLFDDLKPRSEARRLLEQLTTWAAEHPEAQGGLQGDPNLTPDLDAGLLAAARQVSC